MPLVYPGQFASIPAYMSGTNVFFDDFEYYQVEDTTNTGSIQQPTYAYDPNAETPWTTLQGVPGFVFRDSFEGLDTISDILLSDTTVGGTQYGEDTNVPWFAPLSSRSARPTISPDQYIVQNNTDVTIEQDAAASIYYTTDGSTPSSSNGTIYSTSFNVATGTTVKAIAYETGKLPSFIAFRTFVQIASLQDLDFAPIATVIGFNVSGETEYAIPTLDTWINLSPVEVYYTQNTGSAPADPTNGDTLLTDLISTEYADYPLYAKGRAYDQSGVPLAPSNVASIIYTAIDPSEIHLFNVESERAGYTKCYPVIMGRDNTDPYLEANDPTKTGRTSILTIESANGTADTITEVTFLTVDQYGRPVHPDPFMCMASTKRLIKPRSYGLFDLDANDEKAVQAIMVSNNFPDEDTEHQDNDGWKDSSDMAITINASTEYEFLIWRAPKNDNGSSLRTLSITLSSRSAAILAYVRFSTRGLACFVINNWQEDN